jgi:carboxyl-terminal processing protease
VDGVPLSDRPEITPSQLIRGPVGTEVNLTIQRPGQPEPMSLPITRAQIQPPVLVSTLRPDGIGVVTLDTFTTDGASERQLLDALTSLEEDGARAWVLDLRYNSGGAFETIFAVLGAFLPSDTVAVTVESRRGTVRRTPTGRPLVTQRPLAVLVAGSTASAAELTAAVLQDTGRARLFGQTTRGCANLASLTPLGDGSGLIVASERLLAGPRERPIDGVGVTPDEEIPFDPSDPTLRAAVSYLLARLPVPAAP